MSKKINIIVVVYEKEIPELCLLLKSIDLYFDKFSLNNIYITTQEQGEELKNNLVGIIKKYPNIESHIKIQTQTSLIGNIKNLNGWITQQLLKIKTSTHAEGEFSLILDCKNHFINYTTAEDFFLGELPKYKISSISDRFELGSRSLLNTNFINSYELFELNPKLFIDKTFGSITPFIFKKSYLNEIIKIIEEKYNKNFNSIFMDDLKCAEFYMYGAYLHSNKFVQKDYAIEDQRVAILIWESNAKDEKYLNWVQDQIISNQIKIFGIHKKTYECMTNSVFDGVVKIWQAKGLYDSKTIELINKFKVNE